MKLRWPYWLSWVVFFAFAAFVSARMAEGLFQTVIYFIILGGAPAASALWLIRRRDD